MDSVPLVLQEGHELCDLGWMGLQLHMLDRSIESRLQVDLCDRDGALRTSGACFSGAGWWSGVWWWNGLGSGGAAGWK